MTDNSKTKAAGMSRTSHITDEAMKREDVVALSLQLRALEAATLQRRIDAEADNIAADMRKRICELGGTPCVKP